MAEHAVARAAGAGQGPTATVAWGSLLPREQQEAGAEVGKAASVGEGPLGSPALDAAEKPLAGGVGGAAGRGVRR